MKSHARNSYFALFSENDPKPEPIEVFTPKMYKFGMDFYISVFRHIEEDTKLSGFTFFLTSHTPESLPKYGEKVVLIVLQDEAFLYRDYFSRIHCIIRCMGSRPVYLDGLPINRLRAIALVHFIYKSLLQAKHLAGEWGKSHRLRLAETRLKTLHIPLGLFSHFNPDPKPMAERQIDYAFLGSINFAANFSKWFHRWISPPKILARRWMLDAVQRTQGRYHGKIYTTGDFFESIKNQDEYEAALADTKISLVPRGTHYETFRFFESCKAGCVIICEPLPDVWFYDHHPGIVIRDWSQLPALIEELLGDEAQLSAQSREALNYWNEVVSERAIALKLAKFVGGDKTSPAALIPCSGSMDDV